MTRDLPIRPEDLSAVAAAYALGALPADEARAYEAHLASAAATDAARAEAAELADTALQLGLAAPPVAPRPEAKAALFAALDGVPQLPAAEPAVEAEQSDAAPAAVRPVAAPAGPVPVEAATPAEQRAARRWYRTPVAMLAAAAAAVALVVGGVAGAGALRDAQVQQQLAQQISEIGQAPDARMAAAPIERGGTATIVASDSLGRAAVTLDGLEALDDAQIYELWLIDDTGATPAGLFSMPDSGERRIVLDGDYVDGQTIGITVEQAGGSDGTPSDDLVLALAPA